LQKALYKLGWSYLKLRQYDRTVETFLRLLDEKSMVREDIQERVLAVDTFTDLDWDLVHEVVRVMAISFDHLGGGSALTRFFERVGHRGYEEMLCRGLGDFYLAGGKTQEAVNVYTLFLDRYPLHPQAPMLQMSIVRAYDQNREFSRATEARIRLIKDFGEGSRWAERYPREAEGVLHIRLKETTYQLALYFHSEAQRLKRPDEYEKAVGWYRRFLKSYPGAQEAPEVHFMLAEGLYELGRYREAAEAYEAVAYGYPQHSRSGEAGYAALVAYEKWGMNSPQVQKEVQASLIESGKRFVKAFPTGPKVPDVLLKIASLEFREGRREEARSLAERLLSQTGEVPGEMKTEAYQMLAKGYLVGGEYSKAAEALRSALALLLPNQGRERLELQNLLASSLYKEAERVTAAGRPEEAAGLFVHIAEEVPGSPISQAALYDAAILMLDQGKRGTAQTLLERLIASSSPFRSKAQRQLALLYEEEGKYFEAAQLYDRLWEEMEEGPEKADTLFQSAVLFEKSQRWKEAADRFQQFTERFPKEGQGGIEATFRAAQSLFRLGDAAGAEALYSSVIVRYDQGDLSRERTGHFAAKAYLMLGRFRHERFSRILLRAPLEESLRRKEEIMEEASVHYRQAASLKQAEVITEVSYRMGDLFEEFGKALVESERPSELTAGELREYDHLLEQQAQPWREKAVAAYESNVHRTQAVGLYDEWVKKSYGRLARLLPQYYGREELGEVVAREPRF
jgi:TolA-binding protein